MLRPLLAVVMMTLCACTSMENLNNHSLEAPPILRPDDVMGRSYQKTGSFVITRYIMGSMHEMDAMDFDWGFRTLRNEACKVGADGVMSPEITAETYYFALFPYTEIKASGTAITFD